MNKQTKPCILTYGESLRLRFIATKLKHVYGFEIVRIKPGDQNLKGFLDRQRVNLVIVDPGKTGSAIIKTIQLENPVVPVVCLGDGVQREAEIIFQEFSRLETSGLPQVLQLLGTGINI